MKRSEGWKTNTLPLVSILATIAIAFVTTTIAYSAQNSSGAGSLAGTTWQLVKFQGGDDETFVPDDRSKYTITFGSGGRVTARVDCNRGGSTWKPIGTNELRFGSWKMTRAKCSSQSLHDRIVNDGAAVRYYSIKNGHLFLSGMAAGGVYELEPLGGQRRSPR